MKKERFIIRARESGNYITSEKTYKEAIITLQGFEIEDIQNETFVEDFYEIYDIKKEIVLRSNIVAIDVCDDPIKKALKNRNAIFAFERDWNGEKFDKLYMFNSDTLIFEEI